MPIKMYPTLQAYYEEDQQGRLRSPEADYGVHWRLDGYQHPWRVSYVKNTGEIYAVQQCMVSHDIPQRATSYGPLFVLGIVPIDQLPENDHHSVYYKGLEAILEGWTDHCGPSNGLTWIRDRIEANTAARLSETSH